MNIYFNDLIYYGLMLSGSTAAQSKLNLVSWLDAIIYQRSSTSLVLDIDGNREHALFHHIKGPDFDSITGILSGLNAWGAACTTVNISCGKFYVVRYGAGEGKINMQQIRYGPFI